jgi:hypothetical protein
MPSKLDVMIDGAGDVLQKTGTLHVARTAAQQLVDHLVKKAQAGEQFNDLEKDAVVGLYKAFVYGGRFLPPHHPEAAVLLDHYLKKDVIHPIEINFGMYEEDERVKYEMGSIRTNEAKSIRTATRTGMSTSRALVASKMNYADNRFVLKYRTRNLGNGLCETTWRVNSVFKFEGFASPPLETKVTHFPYKGEVLNVSDGLSGYLVDQGIAKPFPYFSQRTQTWRCDAPLEVLDAPRFPFPNHEKKESRSQDGPSAVHSK